MGRRPVGRLLAAGGVLATLALLAPVTAGAEGTGADGSAAPARSVVATGRAQGFRATYTVPDYVIVSEFFDGGGPVTESVRLDRAGDVVLVAALAGGERRHR